MAIAFDAATTNTAYATTATHTCAGTNRLVLLAVETDDIGDTVSAATYDAVSMSLLVKRAGANGGEQYIFGLLNPNTTANATVSLTQSGTGKDYMDIVSYTGVSQSGLPDSFNSGQTASGTTHTASATSIADSCWMFFYGRSGGQTLTASTNSTQRTAQFTTIKSFDSNAAITPAQTYNMSATTPINDQMTWTAVTFAPVAVAATGFRNTNLTLLGVGQ